MTNRTAFLDTIAKSEGTYGVGDNGYNVLCGSGLFHDYSTHPNIAIALPRYNIKSTAAGRYQILYRFWIAYKKQLNLPDFGKESQDKMALQMIKECHALDDIDAGNFESAIAKCSSRWASLPGNGYGQHTNSMLSIKSDYVQFGGVLA